jgi:class 3 adenylate cyclase
MSLKFSSFDAMTRQNKITALMHIKKSKNLSRDDYYLVLHSLLDNEMQVSLAAKMLMPLFKEKAWAHDFGKLSSEEACDRIENFLRQNVGYGPELAESTDKTDRQKLAQNLQKKQKKYETIQEWHGDFPATARILNTLREDTQQLVKMQLEESEKIERAYLCFYNENLKPFKDCNRSLDSNSATTLVNLSRIHSPEDIAPVFKQLFEKLDRPIYLLAIITNKKGMLFLRDELKTSQAAIICFNLQTISSVKTVKTGSLLNIEIEMPQDILVFPAMEANDAYEASGILREKSVEAIESREEFIERDFEKELKKLDMLFKTKAIKNSEYIYRKSRLQKMELEKFSDANIELLLAKRFSENNLGNKFDQQLIKKFTFEKTVMFTDIVGFSTSASQKMLLDTMTLLAVHDKLLMPVVEQHNGKLIKKIGDALMVRFDEPIEACNSAIEMQNQLYEFNKKSEEKIFIRIGLNTGTVFIKNDDVFGDAVNIAARMESLAQPGKTFITEATRKLVEDEISHTDVGLKMVKGKKEPIHVYTISDGSGTDAEMLAQAQKFMQQAGIQTSESVQPDIPDSSTVTTTPLPDIAELENKATSETITITEEKQPVRDPVLEMICALDSARQYYIQAVKNGSERNPDLEDWFARYEEYIKPDLNL